MKRLRLTYWIRRNRKKEGDFMDKNRTKKQLEHIKQRLQKAYSLEGAAYIVTSVEEVKEIMEG